MKTIITTKKSWLELVREFKGEIIKEFAFVCAK